jgi:hypothetical protein
MERAEIDRKNKEFYRERMVEERENATSVYEELENLLLQLDGKVLVEAEFLFQLESKQDWVNKCPDILPHKKRGKHETWLWLDTNGNVLEIGVDFQAAKELATYPVRVYRTINVASKQ